MPGQVGGLQVDKVGDRLQHLIQLGTGDPVRQPRLQRQDGLPGRRVVQPVQHLLGVRVEHVDNHRVELRPTAAAGDPPSRLQAVAAAENLHRPGQLHEPSRQADLLAVQVTGTAAAIPLLIPLTDRLASRIVQADALRELATQ